MPRKKKIPAAAIIDDDLAEDNRPPRSPTPTPSPEVPTEVPSEVPTEVPSEVHNIQKKKGKGKSWEGGKGIVLGSCPNVHGRVWVGMSQQQQQQLARQLAGQGATLVVLGMPPGTEFGIDVNFWNVGERFRGVKMIPPGLHFVYFSAVNRQGDTAPRTGFYHTFTTREVVVRHYNPATEDLEEAEASVEEVERIRANLRQMDQFLGPYPLDSWHKWIALTQHVDDRELQRMIPLSGRVCSAAELTPVAAFKSSRTARHPFKPSSTTTSTSTSTTDIHKTDPETDTQTINPPSLLNTQSLTDITDITDTGHPTETPTDTPQTIGTTTDFPQTSENPTDFTETPTNTLTPTQTHTDQTQAMEITTETTDSTDTPTDTRHTPDTHTPPEPPRTDPQLPEMVPREGTEFRFTQPPKKSYREGASPTEVTRYSMDSSYSVRHMLTQVERPESLLAELQLSFVSFLVGQVWSGWEHWRALLHDCVGAAEEVLLEGPQLYSNLLSILHHQVYEIPEDLFTDIVESNNFLASALTTLFANIADNAPALPPPLVSKALRFKHHLTNKFEWDLTLEEDEGEFAPVVVET
ncbi:Protein AAR2 [Chionoecetes opilio]|uniref:Protein AAR2 homolog n=1 Tax=Chionoecetes opilio TaxID=41210 RepID=A0A8J5CIJ1_CHIOP|nr:Protein AAR2 [Chionoecetes opilio]